MSSTNRRLRRAALRHAAETASNAFGCTCVTTDVKIKGAGWVEIHHDDGCKAIVGRILAVVPKQSGCRR